MDYSGYTNAQAYQKSFLALKWKLVFPDQVFNKNELKMNNFPVSF
jgi:hypothetical protein